MAHIVFDIGGTSTRVARADESGISQKRAVATPADPEEGMRALTELAREAAGSETIEGIAGGFPGVVQDGRILLDPNLPKWIGFPFSEKLSALIGAPVRVRNDADLAALGEAVYGGGQGSRIVAYVGVGTGVGTGRVVDGRVDDARFGFEAGHQILDVQGKRSLEDIVSGHAVSARFGCHPKDAPRAAYEERAPYLAAGILNIVLAWSPDVVVLGGSMVNEENGFRMADVVSSLASFSHPLPELPPIRKSTLAGESGLHGARALLKI